MEEMRVGELVFELDEDSEGVELLTVHKLSDLEGWVTFVMCPRDPFSWSELRNNSYPLNGWSDNPPLGRWIIYEYVGRDSSSLNLSSDRSAAGFIDSEIEALQVVVNLMSFERRRVREEQAKPQITH